MIYIHDIKLGIEYQGIQHFESVKHWGGEKSLRKVQERDINKLNLCQKNKVNLIYYNYDEDITEQLIYKKLKPFLN